MRSSMSSLALALPILSVGDVLDTELFRVSSTSITLTSVIAFVAILVATVVATRWVSRLMTRLLLPRLRAEPALERPVTRIVQYAVFTIGLLIGLQFVGIDLTALAVLFGALGVGIGFGLQNIALNFVSGMVLFVERPVRIGDWVEVGDIIGRVEDINVRATTVRALPHNTSLIVPNSEFVTQRVTNWSHGDTRSALWISVGVSYDSDLESVLEGLQAVAAGHPDVLTDPAPVVRFSDFGDSAWVMALIVWIAHPADQWRVASEVRMAIVRRFRERGVVIPYPQRDLHVRSSAVPLAAGAGDRAG